MTPTTPEHWLPVVGYEGFYEVSDHGRVRSLPRTTTFVDGRRRSFPGQTMSVQTNRHGRRTVNLTRPGCAPKTYQVHPLALTAFVGPRPTGLVACHNNGDPTDNHICNLRWDTPSENQYDAVRHGTNRQAAKSRCKRGHLLVAPNLSRNRQHPNRRTCKACHHAKVTSYRAAKRGDTADVQALADHYYRRLSKEIPCSSES